MCDWNWLVKHAHTAAIAERLGGRKPGKNWTTRFIERNDFKTVYDRKLDAARAYNNDRETARVFFKDFLATIKKYDIQAPRLYNMDEKPIILGFAASSRVIVPKQASHKSTRQPGNRDFLTVIECICADGTAPPPLVIFKGVQHQVSWYERNTNNQRAEWQYATSPNGWNNSEIALA